MMDLCDFRVGDTYPTQHLDVQLKVYLYRWKPKRTGDCGKPDVRFHLLEAISRKPSNAALVQE